MPLEFNYLGDCHHIAFALHRLSTLPLCVLYGERHSQEDPEFILIHMGILYQGNFYDEMGNQGEPRHLLNDFKQLNEKYCLTSVFTFDSSEDPQLYEILDKTHAFVHRDKIEKFMEWAINHKEKFPFIK